MRGKIDDDFDRMLKILDREELVIVDVDMEDYKNAQALLIQRREIIANGMLESEAIRRMDELWAKIKSSRR